MLNATRRARSGDMYWQSPEAVEKEKEEAQLAFMLRVSEEESSSAAARDVLLREATAEEQEEARVVSADQGSASASTARPAAGRPLLCHVDVSELQATAVAGSDGVNMTLQGSPAQELRSSENSSVEAYSSTAKWPPAWTQPPGPCAPPSLKPSGAASGPFTRPSGPFTRPQVGIYKDSHFGSERNFVRKNNTLSVKLLVFLIALLPSPTSW